MYVQTRAAAGWFGRTAPAAVVPSSHMLLVAMYMLVGTPKTKNCRVLLCQNGQIEQTTLRDCRAALTLLLWSMYVGIDCKVAV